MYQFDLLKTNPKATELLELYSPLIPEERYRCCLLGKDPDDIPDTIIIAFAATYKEFPVGLILASYHTILKETNIHSLYVQPEYRQQHISLNLMQHILEEARKRGSLNFTCIYPLNDPYTAAMEKIFASIGWTESRPFMLRCMFNVYLFNTPWIHQDYPFPPDYEEFPWTELTSEDRQELKHMDSQQMIPSSISPFIEEERIEPINSLGLRYKGKIVGWCITHRIAPNTIRYTSLFILPSLQFRKLAMKLLSDSIRMHTITPTPWATFDVPILNVHYSWMHLVKHRLAPYADKVIHFQQAWHVYIKNN